MTDGYMKEFERWIPGPTARKQQMRAELDEHLRSAQAAGDADALSRLGTPREAAEAFSSGHELAPAPLGRRIPAALVDLVTVVGSVVLAVGLGTWASESGGFGLMEGLFIAVILASFGWWGIGLTLMEWRTGRTPGKALFGLRVVSEKGVNPSFGQAVVRRLTLIFSGPLQLIDWGFMFFNPRHQRGLDILAKTVVVSDPGTERLPMRSAVSAHP